MKAAQPSETAMVTACLRAFARCECYPQGDRGDGLARHFLSPEWTGALDDAQTRNHVRQNIMAPGM